MMEPSSENTPVQSDGASKEMRAFSVGATLREARERLGMSVEEVAGQIKLAPRQIEALETDDFKHLPEMAFVRGFVRSYAKLLKLDATTLLETLKDTKPTFGELDTAPLTVQFPDTDLIRHRNLIWAGVAGLLAVLIAGLLIWNYMSPPDRDELTRVETPVVLPEQVQISGEESHSKADVTAPSELVAEKEKPAEVKVSQQSSIKVQRVAKPVVAPSVTKTPSPAPVIQSGVSTEPGTLRLEFEKESWVEIKDRDGNVLSADLYRPGSGLRLEGNAPFSVLIGNAPSVRLYYREKPVDLVPYTRSSTDVANLTLE